MKTINNRYANTLENRLKRYNKKNSKIKTWLNKIKVKLSKRYVNDCHPEFLSFIENRNIVSLSLGREIQTKRAKKILKTLDSDKYRKYFYASVDFVPKQTIKEVTQNVFQKIFDKLIYHLSKTYVFIFEKQLYERIIGFERVSKNMTNMNNKIDDYLKSTTIEQRLSRAKAIKILDGDTYDTYVNRLVRKIDTK